MKLIPFVVFSVRSSKKKKKKKKNNKKNNKKKKILAKWQFLNSRISHPHTFFSHFLDDVDLIPYIEHAYSKFWKNLVGKVVFADCLIRVYSNFPVDPYYVPLPWYIILVS